MLENMHSLSPACGSSHGATHTSKEWLFLCATALSRCRRTSFARHLSFLLAQTEFLLGTGSHWAIHRIQKKPGKNLRFSPTRWTPFEDTAQPSILIDGRPTGTTPPVSMLLPLFCSAGLPHFPLMILSCPISQHPRLIGQGGYDSSGLTPNRGRQLRTAFFPVSERT